ncbi:MAG: glutaredoxin family protein [Myxococcales bacterium]|nr:glutaredoxin family protein [Polyangiaceae bacterium]MDW8250384.1 glutaredoxin family protein [Myxococcales bacterium]
MLRRRRFFTHILGALSLLPLSTQATLHPDWGSYRRLPSGYQGAVIVYGAEWCDPYKRLQQGLRDQRIPFDYIDIDQNPSAHERAKQATGSAAIPVTSMD